MKLYKKSERVLEASTYRQAMKMAGWTMRNLGTYKRWKEVEMGRVSVKLTIWEIEDPTHTCYILEDTLGRVACQPVLDKTEVLDWLREHEYKPEHQWYIEDYGMTEDAWKAWNGEEEQ